jgi:hypothetical protein
MAIQYTQSFAIPSGGWTGSAQGILVGGTSGITANVRLWGDGTNALVPVSLAPGKILDMKVRHVFHSGTVTGLN